MAEPFYITTAISYPNGRPHVGHAYEAITTDAIARYHRLAGRDVFFMTGTDEHGLKMAQAARDQGVEPSALADTMSSYFKDMADALDISYDRFIRTTSAENHAASAAIWNAMADNEDLYLGRYEGWYSVRDEAYYGEDEVVEGKDSEKLSPQGTPVEWTSEESWFFRLSAYRDRLRDHYARNPDFICPASRQNEVVSFVEGGLSDLSVSRTSFDWGVPVPGSPDHVMYVWIDALTSYITGVGYPEGGETWRKYWPADLHVIGKDIVRFHAVYWPAFLMSAGLALPKQVFGHGFVLNRGEKMSKSLGNVVDPIAMAARYGVDALRYFFLREVSFGQDGGYSDEAIVTRANADLANDLGNLAQRTLSMIAKNCEGRAPAPGDATDADNTLAATIAALPDEVAALMEELALHRAIEAIWRGVASANLYISEQQPWSVRKTDPARADTILYHSAEAIRRIAILTRWIIPGSADKLLDQLGQQREHRDFASLDRALEPGIELPAPEGIFPRLERAQDTGD